MRQTTPGRDANVYGIGRPVMFAIWVLALWGTGAGARLLWLFVTDEPKALRLIGLRSVWMPILIAVVMWLALIAAVRRHRRRGELHD
jgi:hypothetical protein